MAKFFRKNINTLKKITTIFLVLIVQTHISFAVTDNSKTVDAAKKTKQVTEALDKKTLQSLITDFLYVVGKYTFTILISLIVLVFMYNIVKYMFKGQESEQARTEGKKVIFWTLIGVAVVASIWAIVAVLASFFGQTDIGIPQF